MTEAEARDWLRHKLDVPRGTIERLDRLAVVVRRGMADQNLIAASTAPTIWSRHIVDSAQLVPLAGDGAGEWIDLGSGAGFPGLVVALLTDRPVVLIESRRKRAEFLRSAVDEIGATNCRIELARVEQVVRPATAVISARAFASLDRTLAAASHLTDTMTRWVLPKGRSARAELESARETWQGEFHVEPSVTDPESAIIVARKVRRRERA